MELSIKRITAAAVEFDPNFDQVTLVDKGWGSDIVKLSGTVRSGDYAAQILLPNGIERVYSIDSKHLFRSLNRVSLMEALNVVMDNIGAEVTNIGLYCSRGSNVILHNRKLIVDQEQDSTIVIN